MDITSFKSAAAAYINRTTASLTVNGVDLILQAANNAKSWAQRMLDFELARVSVDVVVNQQNGGSLTTAVLHSDGVTPIVINRLERAYLQYAQYNGLARPIHITSQQGAWHRLSAAWDRVEYNPSQFPAGLAIPAEVPFVVRQGNSIVLMPNNAQMYGSGTNLTVSFDVVQLLPDYDFVTVTTDFLLTNCYEWMLYKTLGDVCLYIKDLELKKMFDYSAEKSWAAVVAWNDSISNLVSSDDIGDLD